MRGSYKGIKDPGGWFRIKDPGFWQGLAVALYTERGISSILVSALICNLCRVLLSFSDGPDFGILLVFLDTTVMWIFMEQAGSKILLLTCDVETKLSPNDVWALDHLWCLGQCCLTDVCWPTSTSGWEVVTSHEWCREYLKMPTRLLWCGLLCY